MTSAQANSMHAHRVLRSVPRTRPLALLREISRCLAGFDSSFPASRRRLEGLGEKPALSLLDGYATVQVRHESWHFPLHLPPRGSSEPADASLAAEWRRSRERLLPQPRTRRPPLLCFRMLNGPGSRCVTVFFPNPDRPSRHRYFAEPAWPLLDLLRRCWIVRRHTPRAAPPHKPSLLTH